MDEYGMAADCGRDGQRKQCRSTLAAMSHWTPDRVQALRNAYGENTATFAVRFARSPRTIEDWELGRRNPDKLCQRMMDVMAVQMPVDIPRDIAV